MKNKKNERPAQALKEQRSDVSTSKTTTTGIATIEAELVHVEVVNNEMLVNSRLLHQKLKIQTHHRDWTRRRFEEYGFVEGEDFRSNLSESSGGRRQVGYLVTLDVAKELAMLEKSEIGRVIRRYFIEVEKQYRDWIGIKLPQLQKDIDLFGQRVGYDYAQLLRSVGCSTQKSSMRSRIYRHRNEFWKNVHNQWFVSEDFSKTIIAYAIARRWSSENKTRALAFANQKSLAEK